MNLKTTFLNKTGLKFLKNFCSDLFLLRNYFQNYFSELKPSTSKVSINFLDPLKAHHFGFKYWTMSFLNLLVALPVKNLLPVWSNIDLSHFRTEPFIKFYNQSKIGIQIRLTWYPHFFSLELEWPLPKFDL